jgi:hypothetical protein
MYISNTLPGTRHEPLTRLTLRELPPGSLTVCDAYGRAYLHTATTPELTFTIGGALGLHTVTHLESGETLRFRVEARTRLSEASGEFAELLDLLYRTMTDEPMPHLIHYNGRTYYFFVPWLRDHVHTLKGMKYFEAKLYDGIELYRDSQREDGMIWDNVHRRRPPSREDNHWGKRFRYGGFEHTFDDGTAQFTRIPIENDVEYLFVEGLYYTWKATADDGWMAACLDAASKALEYSVTSPYRWSSQFGLLKRGHTIDTWDFQNDADCLSDFVGWPDPMAVHPEKTKFGIMFGDNTGYAAACGYLAEMLEHAGRDDEALRYRQRASDIRQRLDEISWNGRFFTHHVPEDPHHVRDLGVDESTQISLSNAYSLNRGIEHEQAVAILQTYQDLQDNLPPGSPGEWYTIYPPFQKGYGGHNALWQYMNASVTPIVAGELAHGAFEHGSETYGVDILRRLLGLARPTQYLHCAYTGAYPLPPAARFTPLDLAPHANADATLRNTPTAADWQRDEHPNLSEFPAHQRTFAGVPFDVQGALAISDRPGYAQEMEIPLARKAACIYFLHTLARIQSGVGGTIVLNYADGTAYSKLVKDGENALVISHWDYPELHYDKHDKRRAAVAWRANHPQHLNMQVTAYGLDNPHPEKEIRSLGLKAADGGTLWFVLGLTLSDTPVYFPADPISFGIPDQWGAAAVVYALIEGLVGVVDRGTAFSEAFLSPRWPAADVNQAEAVIHYPASNGYIAYRYQVYATRLTLHITGSGETCLCHLLLPEAAKGVEGILVNDQSVGFAVSLIEESRYVDFVVELPGPCQVDVLLA